MSLPEPEDNPYRAPRDDPRDEGPAERDPSAPVSLHRAVFDAWKGLLRPRRRILRDHYAAHVRQIGLDPPPSADVGTLRDLIIGAFPPGEAPDLREYYEAERQVVLVWRVINGWIVFWCSLLPLAAVGLIGASLLSNAMVDASWPGLAMFAVGGVILLYLFCILGLVIQSLLLRPFGALFRRWTGAKEPSRPPTAHE